MPVCKYNKFQSPLQVEAIQYTGDEANLDEIETFIGLDNELINDDESIHIIIGGGTSEETLDIGDWLIKDENDIFSSTSDVGFNSEYTTEDLTDDSIPDYYGDEEPDPMEDDDLDELEFN